MNLKLPSWAATALALIAGVLAVLNQVTFDFSSGWRVYITAALVFLSGLGISPLVGAGFRAALHLSHTVSLLISSVLTTAAVVVTTVHMSAGLKGVLTAVFTFVAGIGFAPGDAAAVYPNAGGVPIPGPGGTQPVAPPAK